MVIGPEGDLTPEEIELLVKAGAIEASFGDLVLRVETAAIYVLSVMAYELCD
jgi:16S rRNA (uracil1498-N3)-methyltransferase